MEVRNKTQSASRLVLSLPVSDSNKRSPAGPLRLTSSTDPLYLPISPRQQENGLKMGARFRSSVPKTLQSQLPHTEIPTITALKIT